MTQTSDAYITVLCACGSADEADELALGLVEHGLAACVQTLPIRSTYTWKGKVERADEVLMLAKTRAALYDKLEAWLVQRHSYDVPEIVALPVQSGLGAYLEWIDETTAD